MKKVLFFGTLIGLGTIIGASVWFFVQIQSIESCLKPSVEQVTQCIDKILLWEPQIKQINKLVRQQKITQLLTLVDEAKPLLPFSNYLLGVNSKPTTYLILLQNDNELRTNGGFFGSFAVATVQNGHIDFRFQDIYVPDGQLPGHVDPPEPIQDAFQQGWYRLRDSDWKADFPKDAETIRWFLTNGNEVNPDILVTLNLNTIKKIMEITGPFTIPEYNTTIDAQNIYNLLQAKAEINFFAGSTQKKDALAVVGKAFVNHLTDLKADQYLQITDLLIKQLNQQNILVHSLSPEFESKISNLGWSGDFKPTECDSRSGNGCLADTVSIIEANLGANKANCCVKRQTIQTITLDNDSIIHKIQISFDNSSPIENPLPPYFYGGNYINFLRFYIPIDAQDITIETTPTFPTTLLRYPTPYQPPTIGKLYSGINFGFQELGFFHTTKAMSQSSVALTYHLPLRGHTDYQLSILKQHGLESSPQSIYLFGQPLVTDLSTSYLYQTSIPH